MDLSGMKNLRIVESILSVVIFAKLIYFMQLIDKIAPLVDTILVIMKEMMSFMIILLIIILSLANCYFLLAQNQVDIQILRDKEELEIPDYSTYEGAIGHVYLLLLNYFEGFELEKP